MRLFLIAALVMFVFSLIVAAGGSFITNWNVWISAAFVAWLIDLFVGGNISINTRRPSS